MILNTSAAVKTARANVWLNALAGGVIEFYSGAVPDNGGAPAGFLLSSISLGAVPGTVSGNVFSLNANTEAFVIAGGSVGFARVLNNANAWVLDIDCGLTGSNAGMIIDSVVAQAGARIIIQSFNLTEP